MLWGVTTAGLGNRVPARLGMPLAASLLFVWREHAHTALSTLQIPHPVFSVYLCKPHLNPHVVPVAPHEVRPLACASASEAARLVQGCHSSCTSSISLNSRRR